MSFVRNFQAEDRNFNVGYWSTYDGNNVGNTDRKRSRNHYNQRNYNNYYDYQTRVGQYGGNFNQCNTDYANYADVVPSSLRKRKYSAPVQAESQKFNLPSTVHYNIPLSCSFQAHPTRSNAYTSSTACVKPDFSIFDDDKPVFMSRDDIDRYSPSRKDGIDVLHETHLRYSYCAFLQNLGTRLELPQTTIGTSMVLCHRFFVRRSHACHDRFLIATAALFLAGKSEESPCPLNSVLRTSSEILHKQEFAILSYWLPIVSKLQTTQIFFLFCTILSMKTCTKITI
jgi:cyclin T